MKSIYHIIILAFLCFFQITVSKAQPSIPADLQSQLSDNNTFYQSKHIINDYYKTKIKDTQDSSIIKKYKRKLKHWNRYFWWNEHYANPQGKLVDYNSKISEALVNRNREPKSNYSRYQESEWVQDGPIYNIFDLTTGEGIGRFDVVAFHPTNTNILYGGSANGGIFRTTNGGTSWQALADYLPTLGVAAICVHPTNPSILYALSGNRNSSSGNTYGFSNGVFKSADGGNTWEATAGFPGLAFQDYSPRDMIMDKNNPSTLFVATNKNIFKTTNGGSSWTEIFTAPTDRTFWEMDFKPGSSSVIYAVGDRNFYKSIDGGATFTTDQIAFYAARISMAVTPDNPNVVMLLGGALSFTSGGDDWMTGVYKSTNSGTDFTQTYGDDFNDEDLFYNYIDLDVTSGQVTYNNTIAISPTNENIVLVGGLCVWSSDDGGSNWTQETAYWAGSESTGAEHIHPDQHMLAYNTDGKVYAANDGGIYVSDDDGFSWDFLEQGLTATQFYHFEVENDEGDTWGGTQDNGIQERDNASGGFYMYAGGDGYDIMTDHPWQVADGESDDIFYTLNDIIRGDNTEISVPNNTDFFGNLAMSPNEEDHIYVGYSNVYESTDAGENWTLLSNNSGQWCISSCQSDNDRIYFAGPISNDDNTARIIRINGGTEANISAGLVAAGFENAKITDIEVSRSNANNVYISSAGFNEGSKVFFTDDGGNTWDNISFNLPNVPVFSLVRDLAAGVYAGTSLGVYYKRSGENHWEPFYNGLPPVPVTEMELYNFNTTTFMYDKIMISTFGRGLWKTDTYKATCPNALTLTGTVEGLYYKDATQSINSSQVIKPSAGSVIKYNAANQIRLTPGFHAKSPGVFRTYLMGCGEEID